MPRMERVLKVPDHAEHVLIEHEGAGHGLGAEEGSPQWYVDAIAVIDASYFHQCYFPVMKLLSEFYYNTIFI